jgi:parvulin-like peptidyl-prolyl isomerase
MGWMRALWIVLALNVIAGCSGGKGPKDRPPTPIDKIPIGEAMIKFRDREVSGAWLKNFCITYQVQLAAAGPVQVDEHSLIKAGMQLLTKILLISTEAERRGLTVSDEEIEARLAKEMAGFESTEIWLKRLEAAGLSREERRKQIRYELLVEKYEKQIVVPEVRSTQASDEQARRFYDKYPDVFQTRHTVTPLLILRTVAKDAPESERQRERDIIERARGRVVAGEKFEDVAREVSTHESAAKGGAMGAIDEAQPMTPVVKEALFKLKAGEISPVIDAAPGFSVFKAVEVKPAGQRSFEEAREEIVDRLLKEGIKRAMERTAQDLDAQARAKDELKWFDLKQVIGEPPPPAPPTQAAPDTAAATPGP